MANQKCDKSEMDKRVRAVQEWILQGQFKQDIINQISKTWGCVPRQSYNIYNKAYVGLHEKDVRSMQEKKALHIEMRLKLFKELKDKSTPRSARVALGIIDSVAKIEGIFENDKGFGGIQKEDENGAIIKLYDGTEIEI